MNGLRQRGALTAAILVISGMTALSPAAAEPGNPAAARTHAAAMVKAARAMVDTGGKDHAQGMVEAARQVIAHGKEAVDAVPFPGNQHARDTVEQLTAAMEQAENAIDQAEQGHADVAMTHAQKSLSHARRGLSHAEAL